MKIYIEVEVHGPEEELAGAAQIIVDKSNAFGTIPVPGTNLTMLNYSVYTPQNTTKAKATKKITKKASTKKVVKKTAKK